MLPPGHIAAGYIIAKTITKIVPFTLTAVEISRLSWLGMLFAFAPDLDFFYAFLKIDKLRIDPGTANHRTFLTHRPIFWLLLGLAVFFLSASAFGKSLGLIIWLCPWTHFVLDSEWGIQWLWPFSKKFYPLQPDYYQQKYAAANQTPPNQSFFQFWVAMLRRYLTEKSSYLEIIIVIFALAIALHK